MSMANDVLKSLPAKLHLNGMLRVATTQGAGPRGLAKGAPVADEISVDWQSRLARGELLRGGVVEIASQGGLAFGTSVALRACMRVQEEARRAHGVVPWCAFVDPTGSLYAPGVHA